MKTDYTIGNEDYEEKACLLCMKTDDMPYVSIPLPRIIEKFDGFISKKDFSGAERLLKYWLSEAESGGDARGIFYLLNESMGFYRKTGCRNEAVECADKALSMIDLLGYEDTVSAATAYINAATVFNTFGEPAKAADLYEKAASIYERRIDRNDSRFAGLYNNLATAYTALGRYGDAVELYTKALEICQTYDYGAIDSAVTYVNLADLAEAAEGSDTETGEKQIDEYLSRAQEKLDSAFSDSDGYYAFVCEKCASAFEYHGWFAYAKILNERSGRIYERS